MGCSTEYFSTQLSRFRKRPTINAKVLCIELTRQRCHAQSPRHHCHQRSQTVQPYTAVQQVLLRATSSPSQCHEFKHKLRVPRLPSSTHGFSNSQVPSPERALSIRHFHNSTNCLFKRVPVRHPYLTSASRQQELFWSEHLRLHPALMI